MKILIIITLFTLKAFCPSDEAIRIVKTEPIRPYEALFKAIVMVESSGNPLAIGDKHLRHKSYGIVQVRRTRLNDYYDKTGIRYYESDMFDPVKSKEVFMYYCSGSDLEVISRRWNGGPNGMSKESTKAYYQKVKQKL